MCRMLHIYSLLFSTPIDCIGHPFDLTKTRLQTAAPGTYTGAIDVVKKTVARDGLSGYAFSLCPSLFT